MASAGDNVIAIITGGGIGAGVATIATAVIQARSGKAEARAHAADLLAEASGTLSAHYVAEIARLVEKAAAIRTAVDALTEFIDELDGIPTETQMRKLIRLNKDAKAANL